MSGCHCGMTGSQFCKSCSDRESCKEDYIKSEPPSWMFADEEGEEEAIQEFYKKIEEEKESIRKFFYNL